MGHRAEAQGRVLNSVPACQVVPDITTFAVDDGFSYLIPSGVEVEVGSRVRIRVSGRRLKGFVTAVFNADPARKLIPIEGLSGEIPSFGSQMLESLRWAATHYVTPLSVLLKRTIPPNVPKRLSEATDANLGPPTASAPRVPVYRVGSPPYGSAIAATIDTVATEGRTVVVIAPTAAEIGEISDHLAAIYGDRVVLATSSMSGAAVTKSWTRVASESGVILVGTREVMFWPFHDLGLAVIVEDGRRVMRSPGTPTLSVRDVILQRSITEGFASVFHGPVPTLEAMAEGAVIEAPAQRQWPVVEVIDRGEEPPSSAMLTGRVMAAIRGSVKAGESVFVLVGSRGYAPAFRCASCGELRRCRKCSSAASRDGTCRRCGTTLGPCTGCGAGRFQALGAGVGRIIDDLSSFVDADLVGRSEDGRLVTVGTERDLIGVHGMGLAVAIDIDGFAMAPHYRAAEDGLRLLVRLAQTVRKGAGHRCVVQTAEPGQPVLETLLHGRSEDFLTSELDARRRFRFPPAGSLIAIETDGSHDAHQMLHDQVADMATIMGPAPVGDRMRWLLQGDNLDPARIALRPVLNTLRAKGAKVRVDVDPIDL